MWQTADWLLVALLVLVSVLYATYSLGSVRLKRRMLEWLIRCCGLRVYNLLSPRVSGCNACASQAPAKIPRKYQA